MVTRWGLSDKLGPLAYMEEEGEVFLGRSSGKQASMSGDTAKVIDEEMRDIIDRNYQRAEEILKDNADILESMTQALMTYETIDLGQIDKLMDRQEPGPPADWGDSGGTPPPVNGAGKPVPPGGGKADEGPGRGRSSRARSARTPSRRCATGDD